MYKGRKVTVIVPAAGSGRRMGGPVNKVYIELLGKPVLRWTLEAFASVPEVDEIIVAVRAGELDLCREAVLNDGGFDKPVRLTEGGEERCDTVLRCLGLAGKDDIVLVHDGARPLVEKETIEAAIEETFKHGCCCVAVPVKDTTKVVRDGVVTETPDRSTLWSAQTPQGFFCGELEEIMKKWRSRGFKGTDEAGFAEKEGKRVFIVDGKYDNIKITTSDDIIIAEAVLMRKNRQEERDVRRNRL